MKDSIVRLIEYGIKRLQEKTILPADLQHEIQVVACKDPLRGDYASNCALVLAKQLKKPPAELAAALIKAMPGSTLLKKVEVAGPGFINFFLSTDSYYSIIRDVSFQKSQFGQCFVGDGKSIHMEYVSANPTGPLHVGHGRSAAFGASLANLLASCCYKVHREYYVNDAGRQMHILALSVWLRYLQLHNESITLPEKAYQGDYVMDIAKTLAEQQGSRFHHTQESLQAYQGAAEPEQQLDDLIEAAVLILGQESFDLIRQCATKAILEDIRQDLQEFGVEYDDWFHESRLFSEGLIQASLELLDEQGYVYEKEGAKWFKATEFGDEKDRVLVRSNGVTTYFASDVAYHLYKYRGGYDEIIDVFGADHHGYIPRIQGFLQALGQDPKKVRVLMVQFAILYRGQERVSMSTRSGEFVTLRQLRDEVGNDAARFFYVMRKPEQHLDFDLELAKAHSNDNPVYYIQYAHARICSVWRRLEASEYTWENHSGLNYLSLLMSSREKALVSMLIRYPEMLENCAIKREPHILAHFLLDFATAFHSYYNAEQFLVEQNLLRDARLCLIAAVQQVLVNGLTILGISAPEKM